MVAANRLTALKVAKLTEPGLHADGDGLYLRVDKSRRWVFIYYRAKQRKEMGLGPYPSISLAQAREARNAARATLRAGDDPIALRRRTQPTKVSFGAFSEGELDKLEAGWSNPKHRQQWRSTLRTYAATFWNKPISEVDGFDVESALRPIWLEKPETARRVRARIERMIDAASAKGLRTGENPARWRGNLKSLLPSQGLIVQGHHAALPYEEMPAFMERLSELGSVSAMALAFTALTAARTGETLGATWAEIDLEAALWIVPATRMKGRREHRVPLATQAIEILAAARSLDQPFLFPGNRDGRPLSNMSMAMVLRRLKVDATPHGFRSTFRDWAGDTTDTPREIAEAALAHTVGNAVERAYRRGNALEKRRALMTAWANFCLPRQKKDSAAKTS